MKKIDWKDYDSSIIELINEGFSYEKAGDKLNLHRERVRKRCFELGIKSKYYLKEKKYCLECNNEIDYGDYRKKFCNHSCAANYNNKKRGFEHRELSKECKTCKIEIKYNLNFCSKSCHYKNKYLEYIERWKNGEEDGYSGEDGVSSYIRKYLFDKYDNKCCECGWNKINKKTNKIPLQIEHIDGNHKNNKEENLKLLCPNCHSLTETYGSLNRGNGREGRKKWRHDKNKLFSELDI